MSKKHNRPEVPYTQMTTWQLIRAFIISKLPVRKEKVSDNKIFPQPKIPEESVNYIAIVLDGVVEDVMRAQNRLAALLLSNPDFVEFDPKTDRPQIGQTRYVDGKFETISNKEMLMSDDQIKNTLKNMGAEVKDED